VPVDLTLMSKFNSYEIKKVQNRLSLILGSHVHPGIFLFEFK
jgi:hypothetical protein